MERIVCPRCGESFIDGDDYIEHVQVHEALDAYEETH